MTKIRIAICDNDLQSAKKIEKFIEKYSNSSFTCDTFINDKELRETLKEMTYDVFILSLDMPYNTGFELARLIRENNLRAFIIFTTIHTRYMPEVFQYHTFDYIIKPFSEDTVHNLLKRITKYFSLRNIFSFNCNNQKLSLTSDDILYCEKSGRYVFIHCIFDQTYKIRLSSQELICILNQDFLRIHQSFVINMNYIHLFKFNQIILKSPSSQKSNLIELPISQNYRKKVKTSLQHKL
ncbi:LytTr DNA-binding domain protein [Enterococcus faecalis 13-SD-W-01]|nr:LytTr DNA-binding domain protein [Enterococcus faecalis 13-SD-W-01]